MLFGCYYILNKKKVKGLTQTKGARV